VCLLRLCKCDVYVFKTTIEKNYIAFEMIFITCYDDEYEQEKEQSVLYTCTW
jgi:hypothetical protein